MIDVDDFVKESCDCSHPRYAHGPDGVCGRTVKRKDYGSLPPAEYRAGEEDDPFAWPSNWPDPNDVPEVEQPCGCRHFESEGTAAAESGGY